MDNIIVIKTTFPKRNNAMVMAESLLKEKLVACAQISEKIDSLYWWKDEIVKDDEYVLSLKTRKSLYTKVERFIKKTHPYDTPEIFGSDIEMIENDYQQWITNETSSKP